MGKPDKNNIKLQPLLSPSIKFLPSIKISYFRSSKERMGSPDMSTPSPNYTHLPCPDDSAHESLLRPSASEQSTTPDEGLTIYLRQVARTAAAACTLIPLIIYFFRLRGGTIAAIVFLAIALTEHGISALAYLLSTVRVRIEFRDRPVQLPEGGERAARSSGRLQQFSDIAMTIGLLSGILATGHRGDTTTMVAIGFHWTAL